MISSCCVAVSRGRRLLMQILQVVTALMLACKLKRCRNRAGSLGRRRKGILHSRVRYNEA